MCFQYCILVLCIVAHTLVDQPQAEGRHSCQKLTLKKDCATTGNIDVLSVLFIIKMYSRKKVFNMNLIAHKVFPLSHIL